MAKVSRDVAVGFRLWGWIAYACSRWRYSDGGMTQSSSSSLVFTPAIALSIAAATRLALPPR